MSAALRKVKTGKSETSVKGILHNRRKRIRLFFLVSGILLLGFGFSLSGNSFLGSSQDVKISVSGEVVSFSQEPVKIDKSLLSEKINKSKNPPVRIIIPSLDIDLPVKEAKVVKGYWEVFESVAGFGLGSSYPDDIGNQVIFAHARKGLFLPLKNAKVGQMVYVLTREKWYSYKIDQIKEVLPSQTEVIAPTTEAILTLYTCSGFSDSKRLIVKAVKA